MKWHVAVLFLTAAAASAQTPSQNGGLKPGPDRPKALDNFLLGHNAMPPNGAMGGFTVSPLLSGQIPTLPPSVVFEFDTVCAIPLVSIPTDAAIDKGIHHKLERDRAAADPMPTFKGLPTCRQH